MQKIMFNDKYGLTQAVLEGRKTVTRRIIPREFFTLMWELTIYKLGEVVAVAQNYKDCGGFENGIPRWDIIANKVGATSAGWTNKMFVRADLMPHRIRITNVRMERLQDISDEDCLREGIEEHLKGVQYGFTSNIGYVGQYPFTTPREAFALLIDKISGKGTWESNPWVFVYEFKLLH
jgi:hypothetical protein